MHRSVSIRPLNTDPEGPEPGGSDGAFPADIEVDNSDGAFTADMEVVNSDGSFPADVQIDASSAQQLQGLACFGAPVLAVLLGLAVFWYRRMEATTRAPEKAAGPSPVTSFFDHVVVHSKQGDLASDVVVDYSPKRAPPAAAHAFITRHEDMGGSPLSVVTVGAHGPRLLGGREEHEGVRAIGECARDGAGRPAESTPQTAPTAHVGTRPFFISDH